MSTNLSQTNIPKHLVFYMFVFYTAFQDVKAQVVSQFTFESTPVTNADIGPDATSISSSAYSDAGGVGGTRGLNAGLPKADLDMVIPGSPTFDINGIDVSFDYQREENAGTFWRRGNSLVINGCNNLSVSYRVDDGAGGYNVVNSGNVYSIPNDNTYRNYRFYYTPCNGYGAILVDGVEVWSNDGPDNRNMYWTGSGDVGVGFGIDGTGNDNTFFDNIIVAEIDCSPLPIELSEFTATLDKVDRKVNLEWTTKSEINNDFFIVEKSKTGEKWEFVLKRNGVGNSSVEHTYKGVDPHPFDGVSYYRLKQTDMDGTVEYSPAVSVNNKVENKIIIYPNPVKQGGTLLLRLSKPKDDSTMIRIYSIGGQLVYSKVCKLNESAQIFLNIDDSFSSGVYTVRVENEVIRLIVE